MTEVDELHEAQMRVLADLIIKAPMQIKINMATALREKYKDDASIEMAEHIERLIKLEMMVN